MEIRLDIENIRNIKKANLVFDFDKGLNSIVGGNASGKSSIMILLSLLVKQSSKELIKYYEFCENSEVKLTIDGKKDVWRFRKTRRTGDYIFDWIQTEDEIKAPLNRVKGYYEGSVFYGSRFHDYQLIEEYMKSSGFIDGSDLMVPAPFIRDTMSYILHGKKGMYENLLQIRTIKIAKDHKFRGKPYFLKVDNNHLISQFEMSSGESMLLSLVDFINSYIVQGGKHEGVRDLIFIIDEIEISLHPSAVDRLMTFLEELVVEHQEKFNIIVIFATHSTEVIGRLNPNNIYLIENDNGIVDAINPCYPNYAIRKLYIPNGYDFLILVEDELAKLFVDKIIRDNNLCMNKLKCTVPAGGFRQVAKLHDEILRNNIIGVGRKIISIYDGDVKEEVATMPEYASMPKLFLPINSVEKFLLDILVKNKNKDFSKVLGDKYFTLNSLDSLVDEYKSEDAKWKSETNNGKKLYRKLIHNLKGLGIDEQRFVTMLCDDIFSFED